MGPLPIMVGKLTMRVQFQREGRTIWEIFNPFTGKITKEKVMTIPSGIAQCLLGYEHSFKTLRLFNQMSLEDKNE